MRGCILLALLVSALIAGPMLYLALYAIITAWQ